jgi:uncharacterized PurR-regulated membrane protein YhhQ (DUF165 family)
MKAMTDTERLRGRSVKRVVYAVLLLWLVLAGLFATLYPGGPTGSRLLDAVLRAAGATMAALLVGQLLEVLWGVLCLLRGRPCRGRSIP